jgi:hypothetical protein
MIPLPLFTIIGALMPVFTLILSKLMLATKASVLKVPSVRFLLIVIYCDSSISF